MTLSEAIGIRIKSIIENRKLTLYQIEKAGGVPRSTLSEFLSGKQKTTKVDTLYQIVITLNMSMKEFFDDPIFDEVTD